MHLLYINFNSLSRCSNHTPTKLSIFYFESFSDPIHISDNDFIKLGKISKMSLYTLEQILVSSCPVPGIEFHLQNVRRHTFLLFAEGQQPRDREEGDRCNNIAFLITASSYISRYFAVNTEEVPEQDAGDVVLTVPVVGHGGVVPDDLAHVHHLCADVSVSLLAPGGGQ